MVDILWRCQAKCSYELSSIIPPLSRTKKEGQILNFKTSVRILWYKNVLDVFPPLTMSVYFLQF